MSTGGAAFLDALTQAGVTHVFANLGSDHPGLLEAWAHAATVGRRAPRLITCPTEVVALSAAHGFAQVSGIAQAVLVHVDCGTQSLAGAMHNAAKGRIPVLIFAGTSPFTQHGELKGSRNEFAQWTQDVFDQRGLVRGYVKYENELRTAKNIREIIYRALRFAGSDPKGPVYLTGSREIMEEVVTTDHHHSAFWNQASPSALTDDAVERISRDLLNARRPLIITSYLGRNLNAVRQLLSLCDRLAIGVLDSVPSYLNYPNDREMYQGNQWNGAAQNPVLAEADVILIIDSDVPWIPLHNRPRHGAKVHHIDVDPLKVQMPLAPVSAQYIYQADAETALHQINTHIAACEVTGGSIEERRSHYANLHRRRDAALGDRERPDGAAITAAYLTACIRRHLTDDCVVLNEGISNYQAITDHLRMTMPGSLLASGGSSLGWSGGAAIGAKLASPAKTVVSLTGDGSYLMSCPSTVHWMARRYEAPFVQIVYNNGGWNAPRLSMLALHPDGYASKARDIGVSFSQPPDYGSIAAAAGGSHCHSIHRVDEVEDALRAAFRSVRHEGRAAVLDVHIEPS